MALISATELNEQADLAYIRGTYYVVLLYSTTDYTSAVTYTDILADEVTAGTGGYARLSFTYSSSDLLAYSNGQPLTQRTANFVHDGSSEEIVFTHVGLLREVSSTYTVVGIEAVGEPAILSNGKTAVINIDVLHGRS